MNTRLHNAPGMTRAEQDQLTAWNQTTVDYPQDQTIVTLFAAQAAQQPHAIAVRSGGTTLSYQALNRQANQLAHYLRNLTGADHRPLIQPDTLIGICVERSPEMIVGLLGILKAGAAYVPLDPDYPAARLADMLADSQVPVLLTQGSVQHCLTNYSGITIQLDDTAAIRSQPEQNLTHTIQPDHLAYVLFTSGSTGRPKGVMVEHRSVSALVHWAQTNTDPADLAGTLAHTSINFDISVYELFVTLCCGGCLILVKNALHLADLSDQEQITSINIVPSVMTELHRMDAVPATVRCINLIGEPLKRHLVTALYQRPGVKTVCNLYGPTEDTYCSTWMPLPRDLQTEPAIGQPITNTRIYILDAQHQQMPIGVPGELCIAGAGLARGYLNRPELTAEKFVEVTLSGRTERVYKTGDSARWLPDGNLEYVGRIDHQIKLRGFRVEPGEIEARLTEHPDIRDAVVAVREDHPGQQQLVGYLITEPQVGQATQTDSVAQWQMVYEEIYAQTRKQQHAALNLLGWNSSYTGQPIPEAEMLEWIEHTLADIRRLHGRRILEIGCGTGLLLSQLAPDCETYWGTDCSREAIQYIEHLRTTIPELQHVRTAQCMADDFTDLTGHQFDLVVLNSITQHFPSTDYLLQVLAGAAQMIRPGGRIYIGDVRNFCLLPAYHAMVQTCRAPDNLPLTGLDTRIRQHLLNEEELLIDPAFFYHLQHHLPDVTQVEVQLKRGRYSNEMNQFRYQVVLHIRATDRQQTEQPVTWLEQAWQADLQNIDTLTHQVRQHLAEHPAQGLLLRDIPNGRIQTGIHTLDILQEPDPSLETVGQLRAQLAQQPPQMDPDTLRALADVLPVRVIVTWSQTPHQMDAWILPEQIALAVDTGSVSIPHMADEHTTLLPQYANNPLAGKLHRTLIPEIRTWLTQTLPAYMIPAAFVILDTFPLTPNGKLDREALPAPLISGTGLTPDAEEATRTDWQARLQQTAPDERVLQFRQYLSQQVAQVSGYAGSHAIDTDQSWAELGIDSLMSIDLKSRIARDLALNIPMPELMNTSTAALATVLNKRWVLRDTAEGTQYTSPTLPEVTILPAERYAPFGLTDVQHAYWVGGTTSLELGGVAMHYYVEVACAQLDVARLTQALNALVARHEMLRVIISTEGHQQILPEVPQYQITTLDCRETAEAAEAQRLAWRAEMSHQNRRTDQWPHFDVRVVVYPDHNSMLHISLNLLGLDAGSLQIVFREWFELYQDVTCALPDLTLSFRDYLLAEQQLAQTDQYTQARDYWLARLDDLPAAPALPLTQTPAALQTTRFRRHQFRLARAPWEQLKAQAAQAGVTPTCVLLAAFSHILATWSRTAAFTLNLTLFQRLPLHPQADQIIGDFTTLTLLAVDTRQPESTDRMPIDTLARRIQRQLWQDLDHRAFSGVQVLRELSHKHGRTIMPVVFTSVLGLAREGSIFPAFGSTAYQINQTPQVMLDYVVSEDAGELHLHWDVVAELFPPGLIEAMFAANQALLTRLAADKTGWQDPAAVWLPAAQKQQRDAVNATEQILLQPDAPALLHTLFLQQVAPCADQPAVITPQRILTYAELAGQAAQIADWLRQRETRPNTLVAIVLEKGWEQIVAVLGIQLAGAAYLPIDPELPTERQHYLLEQGEVQTLLTVSALDNTLDWPHNDIARLCVDTLPETPDGFDIAQYTSLNQPTDIAYVIYTSGSTGQPKGVVTDHRGAVNTILDINQRIRITKEDRVLGISALNFDLSVYDIFGPLAVGGAVVLPAPERRTDPAHWCDLITQHQVTVWNTVPALMQMLVDYQPVQAPAGTLRQVMMSGDWIPLSLPERIRAHYPQAAIYSLGGATEAAIWSICYPIEQVDPAWRSIPYGKPLANQTFQVLDEQMQPRPVWVPGDLYIGGIGLAQGYWRDEARTAAQFITHPRTGERLYKTGDLGRYLPDGNIEFAGRADFQVKIRGHRIEPGEIEAALRQHATVQEAVVRAVGDAQDANKQLVAYITGVATAEAVPDQYLEHPQASVLSEPLERTAFKLSQPGVRTWDEDTLIAMPLPVADDALRQAWLSRQSYRQFSATEIALTSFSNLLSNLRQMTLEAKPLPKYRYPSAGNLYPVQAYLYIKPERIQGLAAGYYYYQPARHKLGPCEQTHPVPPQFASVNQPIFAQAAFAIFLIADLNAIQPMYGELARDFCLLEAGYMSQLLMTQAPEQQLGLCPIGGLQETALRQALDLGEHHLLLHSLTGGHIQPEQMTDWLHTAQPAATESWPDQLSQFLAGKLPSYMVPAHYVMLDTLPLSANGKVDYQALPEPDVSHDPAATFVAPATPTEQQLAVIWTGLLDLSEVSTQINFFDLGGNSLTATRMIPLVRQHFQVNLPLWALYENSTLAELADFIDTTQAAQQLQQSPDAADQDSEEFAL